MSASSAERSPCLSAAHSRSFVNADILCGLLQQVKEALSEFAHTHGLEDSKTLVIGSSEQMVLGAKERGFAAFLYENPAHTVRTLISLGVK